MVTRFRSVSGRWLRIVLFALPVLLVSAFSIYWTYRALTNSALLRRQAVAELGAAVVREKFDGLTDLGVSLATRVRFRQLVADGLWTDAMQVMQDIPRNFPIVDRLLLTDTNGTLRADWPAAPGVMGKNFSARDWYQGVSRNWTPYISEIYRRAAEPVLNVVAIALPIRAADDTVRGILVLQLRAETISAWLQDLHQGARHLYIVDRHGNLAGQSGMDAQRVIVSLARQADVQQVMAGERGVYLGPDSETGEKTLSVFVPVARYGWGVVMREPAVTAFAVRTRQVRIIAWASGFLVLLSGLLAWTTVLMLDERRRREEESARLNGELARRAQALEAANQELEAFSYSASHDLRAPLRAVSGFARILEEDYSAKLDDEGRGHLRTIERNVRAMTRLIDDLLEFSRVAKQAMKNETIDMNALVKEVFHDLEVSLDGRSVQLRCDNLPPARGDAVLVRQVVSNLLSNALKFTRGRAEAVIEAGAQASAQQHEYWIRDNGAGFDMAYRDKLFGVFQRLHSPRDYEGTGVGLSIVARVVHRHGGRVWAEGQVDQGATFHFTLPAAAP